MKGLSGKLTRTSVNLKYDEKSTADLDNKKVRKINVKQIKREGDLFVKKGKSVKVER